MGYKAIIGLEMHCEVSETNSKVFSPSKNGYASEANVNINAIDLAFPGVLPTLNKEAVRKALMTSIILNCKQPEYMYFERKNYYYPDMPKNFQITQETKPIPVGIYGTLEYECNGEKKIARINNLHLEEDAASQDHYSSYSLIDYNRAGVPLLELVTEACFHSADEAVAFLETMRSIYQYAGVSEADSKKGQIRCDVNVSIMDEDLDETDPKNWGTKVETKNVNSFSAVRETINYEIKRQTELKEDGKYDEMPQQTRRWDDTNKCTTFMRDKVNAVQYRYFIEPNIPKIKISEDWIKEIKTSIPELPHERKERYVSTYGLKEIDSTTLIKEKKVSDYFDEVVRLGGDAKEACNWITTRLLGYLNKEEKEIDEVYMTPSVLYELMSLVKSGAISTQQAKEVFVITLNEEKMPKEIVKEKGMEQVSDEGEIITLVNKVLDENPQAIETYKAGKTNILGFLVGQVLKQSGGKFNPALTNQILTKELEKRL